ncbi:hypothetical protein BUALT_Bualt14G0086500 [Buddleja alternifolia]|uniref:Uncharacterized protein n=1 Tax=Buddleja alternifolia TaxID=168488 RepID=A0AAV6WQ03_9LAMI|nr:hypothetical protein BUALT_Bualt14G0086500 [Buddleja alternifolia]
MATEEQKFPPQKQEDQPGKQHLMDPIPLALNPKYKHANKLHGKVALVTGGDSGIGRSVCYLFALEGASMAFTYVPDTLRKIQELKAPDAKDPMALSADVGFDENCKMVVDEVLNNYGRIDILVNNAAEQHMTNTVEEIDEPRLERVFKTNIFSHFYLTRYALKHMKEGSSIINSTSVVAYCGSSMLLDYCSTKGAIVSFTRGLALQLVGKRIRVNAVAAGPVWTPLQVATKPEEEIKKIGSETPMGRAAQPHEIAPSYVFLASNESSYFTGQVLHPNDICKNKSRRKMATEGHKFPPQKQESQPGKEHLMNPIPQSLNLDYHPANKLQGKVSLVTGGDSGIGRYVCYYFAKEGATVAFTYVEGEEEQDAHDTLQKIKELKLDGAKDSVAVPVDLGYDENCRRVVDKVVENYERIDILVNNAAESRIGSIEEMTEEQLGRMHALKHMREGSTIINTTSVQAYLGSPSSLEYQLNKGAIVAFTRGLALQLIHRGIRVNDVVPGPVWTSVQVVILDEDKIMSLGSETPMDRAAQPNEIAPFYVFLASDNSSYFTGQILYPNGVEVW